MQVMGKVRFDPQGRHHDHVNRADSRAVNPWRYRAKRRISRLKMAGFTILAEDEAFFTHDTESGRKY